MSHTPKYCSLSGSLYNLLLIARNAVKKLLDKLNDVQFKYQHVHWLCSVFNFSFDGSVCVTKRLNLGSPGGSCSINYTSKETNESQLFLERLMRKHLKKQLPSTSKKTTLRGHERQICSKAFQSSIKVSIRLLSCTQLVVPLGVWYF